MGAVLREDDHHAGRVLPVGPMAWGQDDVLGTEAQDLTCLPPGRAVGMTERTPKAQAA
jgi:hypothetical protein